MIIPCKNCQAKVSYNTNKFCDNCGFLNYVASKENSSDNYFAYLGIEFSLDINLEELETKYLQLMQKYHPDNFSIKSEDEKANALLHSSYLNFAYNVLKNDGLRLEYCYEIINQNKIIVEEQLLNNPALAMEFFELYEQLEKVDNIEKYQSLLAYIKSYRYDIFKEIKQLNLKTQNQEIQNLYKKVKYLDRITQKLKAKKINLVT